MKLNPPKQNIWYLCLILAVIGLILWGLPWFMAPFFDYQSVLGFVLMALAYVLLMLGTALKGM